MRIYTPELSARFVVLNTTRIVQSPKVQDHFQKLAILTKDLDPAAVQKFIAEEYAFWAPLAKAAGLRVQ